MVNPQGGDRGRFPQRVLESPEPDHCHPFDEGGRIAVKCWITTDKKDSTHRKQIYLICDRKTWLNGLFLANNQKKKGRKFIATYVL